MLTHLSRQRGQWYTPELMSTCSACVGLHRQGYLERRVLPFSERPDQPRFEYRIDAKSPVLREARALGLLQ